MTSLRVQAVYVYKTDQCLLRGVFQRFSGECPYLMDSLKLNSSSLRKGPCPATITRGEILFTEGDPCTGLFVIESGHVRIFKNSPNGREQILTIEGPGSSVAELPLFDGGTYPASSAAVADARIYFISKQDMENNILFPRAIAMESEKEVSV